MHTDHTEKEYIGLLSNFPFGEAKLLFIDQQ